MVAKGAEVGATNFAAATGDAVGAGSGPAVGDGTGLSEGLPVGVMGAGVGLKVGGASPTHSQPAEPSQ